GRPAPVLDGLTGPQRFFYGWAQVWRFKARDAEVLRRLAVDPHSPPRFRVNGTASNLDPFYSAFNVKPGDRMYLAPRKRTQVY
ncbi:MAG: peptidase M13, partial [Gammaproteobacteria bacterium]|nr:peptidase M13 [Gammaproteobacteria bacterium]